MGALRGVATFVAECRSALRELPPWWSLTPVKGKKPYRPRWAAEPPVDRELIAEEIARGHASGFALRTGPASGGVFAVDEDGPGSLDLLPGAPGRDAVLGLGGQRPARPPPALLRRCPRRTGRRFATGPCSTPPRPRERRQARAALRLDDLGPAAEPASALAALPRGRRAWRPARSSARSLPSRCCATRRYEAGEADSIVNAAWRGDHELVAAALGAGVAPDTTAPDGHTALERAVWGGHIACAELLIAAGASVARPDPEQGTPLILAAAQGQTEIVGALLDAGAPVDQTDPAGRTALHAACWGGHADAAELLVAAGADRRLRDRSGALAADEARRWGHDDLARWARPGIPADTGAVAAGCRCLKRRRRSEADHDSPMRHREFRRFIYARTLSQLGGWMQTVAAGWLVFQITGNATAVGILAAIATVPVLRRDPVRRRDGRSLRPPPARPANPLAPGHPAGAARAARARPRAPHLGDLRARLPRGDPERGHQPGAQRARAAPRPGGDPAPRGRRRRRLLQRRARDRTGDRRRPRRRDRRRARVRDQRALVRRRDRDAAQPPPRAREARQARTARDAELRRGRGDRVARPAAPHDPDHRPRVLPLRRPDPAGDAGDRRRARRGRRLPRRPALGDGGRRDLRQPAGPAADRARDPGAADRGRRRRPRGRADDPARASRAASGSICWPCS